MLMQIDGTFIMVVISFLVFLFIIKKILFEPITTIINERENFYNKNLKMEQNSKEKSKNLLLEKEEKLKQSNIEAGKITKEALQYAKNKSEEQIKETKKEIKNKTEQKTKELDSEKQIAKNEIKNEISAFVSAIASKVLNENVQITPDENKIKEYLNI